MSGPSRGDAGRISVVTATLLAGAVALLGALGYLGTVPFEPPLPDFARFAAPCDLAFGKGGLPHIPVPLVPEPDVAAGNGLACVFVHRTSATALEVSYVFADEDHPSRLIDLLYDRYRWLAYGRVADVETVVVEGVPDPAPCRETARVRFPGTFAGGQAFDVFVARHHSAVLDVQSHPACEEAQPPHLRVATWNHLFDTQVPVRAPEVRLGDRLEPERPLARTPVYAGSRADVEAIFAGSAPPLARSSGTLEPAWLCRGCPFTPHARPSPSGAPQSAPGTGAPSSAPATPEPLAR